MTAPVPAPLLHRALTCRTRRLPDGLDLPRLAGELGFVWRSPSSELIAKGSSITIPLPAGPDRIALAGAAAAELLAAIPVDGERGPARGPVAVGALPYGEATPGELVVPEIVLRRAPDGSVWESRLVVRDPDLPVGVPVGVPGGNGAGPSGRAANGSSPNGAAYRNGKGGDAVPGEASEAAAAVARPGLAGITPLQDEASWHRMIEAALDEIRAGTVGKVVLARELVVEAEAPFSRAAVLARLAASPGCCLYAHDGFVGASPELLVQRSGRRAVSVPLAGTVARGDTPEQEAERIRLLEGSAKDAAEHQFVIDAITEALGTVADVTVLPRKVLTFNNVAHLATRIEAELREPAPSALALVGLLHPTPAVGGTPRAAALALQARLERFNRGRYAGPVGWMDSTGDGEWAVALRGAELDGASAKLRAGVGVVAGSDPEAEWAEAEAKFGVMLDALLPPGTSVPGPVGTNGLANLAKGLG